MKRENNLFWIWLSLKCGVASKEFGKLASSGLEAEELYRMESQELERLDGIGTRLKEKLGDKSLESAYEIYKYCHRHHVSVIPYTDERYPIRLRTLEDPPVLLYAVGRELNWNQALCIGMVGTRTMSEYGKQTAYTISYELASTGVIVVSGMALGVDGVSACGALASGGETVAVLGCGIATVYPKEHKTLMSAILKQGTVLTEYPPAEPPRGENFPKRNRLISGLSQGVLVIEGAARSGALITAKKAVEQGRELFALPGKINESNSDGPNELIQNGARVALHAEDILRFYDFLYHDKIRYEALKQTKRYSVEEAMKRYGIASRGRSAAKRAVESEQPTSAVQPEIHREKPAKRKESVAWQEPVKAEKHDPIPVGLDDASRAIWEAMPKDRAVPSDSLLLPGLTVGDVMTALTMLELSGLVSSLPGGLYKRN